MVPIRASISCVLCDLVCTLHFQRELSVDLLFIVETNHRNMSASHTTLALNFVELEPGKVTSRKEWNVEARKKNINSLELFLSFEESWVFIYFWIPYKTLWFRHRHCQIWKWSVWKVNRTGHLGPRYSVFHLVEQPIDRTYWWFAFSREHPRFPLSNACEE